MMKTLSNLSNRELKSAFGDHLSESDLAALKEDSNSEFDLEFEKQIQKELTEIRERVVAADTKSEEIPDSIIESIARARNTAFAENEKEEAKLDAEIASSTAESARKRKEAAKNSWVSQLFTLPVFGGLVGAAAIALGFFLVSQNPEEPGVIVLAPGLETGFSDPVIVWKRSENLADGFSTALDVIDAETGEVFATADSVNSPVGLSSIASGGLLKQGHSYRLRFHKEGKTLAESTFATTDFAVLRGPEREESLDGVIRQCEAFIASGRPADAWMLWGQLTAEEKQDSRIQKLREIILSKIG